MKTKTVNVADIRKDWFLVDADGKTLGRFASQIARILRGVHKPDFSPHLDMGDNVVVINAAKIRLSGNKEKSKIYFKHSGYPGGTTFTNVEHLRRTHPERIVINAIRGMLPKTKLGRAMLKHLKVYAGPDHPHTAQQPQPLDI